MQEQAAGGAMSVLFLHPAHQKRSHKPLIEDEIADLFIPVQPGPAPEMVQEGLHHPAGSKRLHFMPDHVRPRLSTADRKVSVSLHLTRVQLGADRSSGLPLLTIAAPEANTRWLVLVIAGMSEATYIMAKLGRYGAIRSDFHDLYGLGSPFAEGSFAVIFALTTCARGIREDTTLVGKVGKAGQEAARPDSHSSSAATAGKQMLREASMLAALQGHPNVLRLCGLFEAVDGPGPRWILAVERCRCDLHDSVARGPLPEHRARRLMAGVFSALAHVHALGFVHRDVKPANVLLAGDGRPVVADFGMAAHVSDAREMARCVGTPGYMAPEVLTRSPYGCKVDCFSAGCVLHCLLCGRSACPESGSSEELWRTVHGIVTFEDASFSLVSGCCKDAILRLLQRKAQHRLAMAEALAHPWVAQDDDVAPNHQIRSTAAQSQRRDLQAAGRTLHHHRDASLLSSEGRPSGSLFRPTTTSLHSSDDDEPTQPRDGAGAQVLPGTVWGRLLGLSRRAASIRNYVWRGRGTPEREQGSGGGSDGQKARRSIRRGMCRLVPSMKRSKHLRAQSSGYVTENWFNVPSSLPMLRSSRASSTNTQASRSSPLNSWALGLPSEVSKSELLAKSTSEFDDSQKLVGPLPRDPASIGPDGSFTAQHLSSSSTSRNAAMAD